MDNLLRQSSTNADVDLRVGGSEVKVSPSANIAFTINGYLRSLGLDIFIPHDHEGCSRKICIYTSFFTSSMM